MKRCQGGSWASLIVTGHKTDGSQLRGFSLCFPHNTQHDAYWAGPFSVIYQNLCEYITLFQLHKRYLLKVILTSPCYLLRLYQVSNLKSHSRNTCCILQKPSTNASINICLVVPYSSWAMPTRVYEIEMRQGGEEKSFPLCLNTSTMDALASRCRWKSILPYQM